jgi:hypothetical protein
MSLHLHQVPQADMLECKLEILLLVPDLTIHTTQSNKQLKKCLFSNLDLLICYDKKIWQRIMNCEI